MINYKKLTIYFIHAVIFAALAHYFSEPNILHAACLGAVLSYAFTGQILQCIARVTASRSHDEKH